jgi:dihydrofolate reductase
MQFKIIVAVCKNNGIGYKQDLPWKIKEDLRLFSKTTKGNGNNAIVMGKNTWLSIGEKPLPKRDNLILSKSLYNKKLEGDSVNITSQDVSAPIFDSIESLKSWCREKNYEEIWIIGGESIYNQFINDPDTKEICITKIDNEFECDTFFIDLEDSNWTKSEETILNTTQEFNVTVCQYLL